MTGGVGRSGAGRKWCSFALRVLALAFTLGVMLHGAMCAVGAKSQLDFTEIKRTTETEIDLARVAERELGLVLGRNVGCGIAFLGGLLFVWCCIGLTRKESPTRKAGVVVVTLAGVFVCYTAYLIVTNNRLYGKVYEQNRERIDATSHIRVAGIMLEKDKWPPDYSNIVSHLERGLSNTNILERGDVAWGSGILSECYLRGRGCAQDVEKSRTLAGTAAALGDERGAAVLKSIADGDIALPPDPVKAILDMTGVDVTAIQQGSKREFTAPKPISFFRKGASYANGDGRIRRVSFLGNYGKGVAMSNGVEKVEKLIPEICRRSDAEILQSGDGMQGMRWWLLGFRQTKEWIISLRLYHAKGDPVGGELLVAWQMVARNPDGCFPGTNCRLSDGVRRDCEVIQKFKRVGGK